MGFPRPRSTPIFPALPRPTRFNRLSTRREATCARCPPLPRSRDCRRASRARVRALAAIVGCDIHPVNNRRILEALRHRFGADEDAVNDWCATWIAAGFDAFEAIVDSQGKPGPYALGEQPTVADVYLVPQVESARRFKVDISRWPRIAAIDSACGRLEAFSKAAPAAQPDSA